MRKMWKKREGFTLIELLIVVAIIGILAGIAIPNFLGARNRARVARVFADFRTIGTALESYYVDNTEYPAEDSWVADLGEYITSIPNDPFADAAYTYLNDGAAAADTGDAWLLLSVGPDGVADIDADTELSFADADRVSGQLGGPDGVYDAYGLDNTGETNNWYDPEDGAASEGDLGRSGP